MITLRIILQEKFRRGSNQNRNGYLCLRLIEDTLIESKFVPSRGKEVTSCKLSVLLSETNTLCADSFRETLPCMKRV